MKIILLLTALALAGCGEDKPPQVVHETRVVHHYHQTDRSSSTSNPDNFEPVERPATYSH